MSMNTALGVNKHGRLLLTDDITMWRRKYLRQIRQYRNTEQKIYYLDETCINEGYCTSGAWTDTTVENKKQAFLSGKSKWLRNPIGKIWQRKQVILPTYHDNLSPMELVWSSVKAYIARNNKSFKLKEVCQLLDIVLTPGGLTDNMVDRGRELFSYGCCLQAIATWNDVLVMAFLFNHESKADMQTSELASFDD
ncbi:hypothetical protein ANN_13600 [Periplaneta americana]|uniref:Tc1-like transposase DDE domain-containing protein n=1 Tax=Periplaneta americana TaxID=6978 RepID=A0ABQ8TLY4_PERAM|nr:hypothetical protein ANN_13600 [Periplaneta americana]